MRFMLNINQLNNYLIMYRCVCRVVTAKSGMSPTNEVRTKAMNKTSHEVQTRWLESRQPNERNGNEAEKFTVELERSQRQRGYDGPTIG